jgi:type 2 lantibiotic biosynthesis protein LanM
MSTDQSLIDQIISSSSFLYERLTFAKSNANCHSENDAENRMKRWRKSTAKDIDKQFQKRLDWDGLDAEQVKSLFGNDIQLDEDFRPKWSITLSELLESFKNLDYLTLIPSPVDGNNSCPFKEFYMPMLSFARDKVVHRLGHPTFPPNSLVGGVLSINAYLQLERGLLETLFNTSAKTFYYEYSVSRSFGHNLLNILALKKESNSPTELYEKFINKHLVDGFQTLFKQYPVLARFIALIIDFWVEATAEFIERLGNDYDEINMFFNPTSNNSLGQVADINVGISDLHNNHHSVVILTFHSGLKLVYKPKNLGLEEAFLEFLNWCNRKSSKPDEDSILLSFKILKILNKTEYGWVEFLPHEPCMSEQAASDFYVRAGQLLCILYLLGATDCHSENLVASGEDFVLVDMETALQHEAKLIDNLDDTSAFATASTQLADSVLRTGLMPMWEFTSDQSIAYDLSGLGSVDNEPVPTPSLTWKSINTDDMHPAFEEICRPMEANTPILNGKVLSPAKYVSQIIFGFDKMFNFLCANKEFLLSGESALKSLFAQDVRFIFRPTRIYAALLGRVMPPEPLKHGLDWSIEVDILSRSFLESEKRPLSWPILTKEAEALYQLDIPYFSSPASSDDLSLGSGVVLSEYFRESCSNQILRRLRMLDTHKCQQQKELIRLSIHAKDASILQQTQTKQASPRSKDPLVCETIAPDEFIAESEKVAALIEKQAIIGSDHGYSWISLGYVVNAERFQLRPLGHSFYDGNCGISLFFAALAHVTGKEKYYDNALRSISELRAYLQSSHGENFSMDLGGGTGIGSIFYTLVKASEFLQLPELANEAVALSKHVTVNAIESDKKHDIIGGVSGAILGILALGDDQVGLLQKATACGKHLIKFCRENYQPQKPNPRGLVGYSHGAAGIAYALLRLYAATNNHDFLDAARQAISYENLLFYPNEGNWREITPIYNPSSPPVFWTTWCHGAPGIALGRIGGYSIDANETILRDIDIGLHTTQNVDFQELDHICCGNMGRAEIMLVASEKLGRPEWEAQARGLGSRVVKKAREDGHYQLFADLPGSVFNPSFFQGASGIGYHLLRLANPSKLPSVLLWE